MLEVVEEDMEVMVVMHYLQVVEVAADMEAMEEIIVEVVEDMVK